MAERIDCKKIAIYILNHEHGLHKINKEPRRAEVIEFIENITGKDAYENGLKISEAIDGGQYA